MRKKVLIFTFVVLCSGKVQGQTVVYTYDAAGGCTSRVFTETQARAKSKSLESYDETRQLFKVDIASIPYINGNIAVAASFLDGVQEIPYVLSNISGQVFAEGLLVKGNNTISVPDLQQGVYILKVGEDDCAETYKLVKK